MVLHELAHSYHDRVLGFDNAQVRAAYNAARDSGKYDRVLRANGRTEKHDAMNNQQEYFAEATEAFFGTNDFYPFVYAELKEFDPRTETLLRKLWGVDNPAPATRPTTRPATRPVATSPAG
jgi:hypothetical protein